MIEINCETDFVARTDDFASLAHDIAMQVAAMSPTLLAIEDASENENVTEDQCLLSQPFFKYPSKTIQDLLNETVGKLGENIRGRRCQRFSLGE